ILDALKKAAEQRSGPPPEVRRLLSAAPVAAVSASRYVTIGVAAAGAIALAAVVWMWAPAHDVPAPLSHDVPASTVKPVASLIAAPTPGERQQERPRVAADDRPRVPLTAIDSRRDAARPPADDGRKYVEGDAIGDGAHIEEIQANGVVLVEDGRRVTVRP